MKKYACSGLAIGAAGMIAAACSAAEGGGEGTSSREDAIRFGTPFSPAFESVVLVETFRVSDSQRLFGSGILLSPDWVLTAGHIVDGAALGAEQPREQTFVTWGNVDDLSAPIAGVEERHYHPKHVFGSQTGVATPNAVDIALLRIFPPFDDAPTRTLFTGTAASLVGQSMLCFGYGFQNHTSTGQPTGISGQLTSGFVLGTGASTNFVQVEETLLSQIQIQGDSGGPCMPGIGSTLIYGITSSSRISPNPQPHNSNVVVASAFRSWANSVMFPSPTGIPGDAEFCSTGFRCIHGGGDCDATSECAQGLVCDNNIGHAFGMPASWEACVPSGCETRTFGSTTFCTNNCRCGHGGSDCEAGQCLDGFVCDDDVGRAYNLPAGHDVCVPEGCETRTLGATNYCVPGCPCGHGGGDCDTAADCLPGLRCVQDNGPTFGYPVGHDVCVP